MLELKRPIVFTDTETTGLHPQVDRIVQLGIVKIYPDQRVTEWQTLINPGIPIPPESTAVHHITDEMVKDEPSFKEIAPKIAGGLMGCDVGGFNVWFDLRMLRAEFERVGGKAVLNGVEVVDAYRIFAHKEPRNLEACYERFTGKKLEGAHDALIDARASYEAFLGQLNAYPDLPRTVTELHKIFFQEPAQGHLDADGKLAWRHNKATINFGKWAAVPLDKVDRGYLEWMLKSEFSDSVKHVIRECLAGRFPRRD